MGDKEIGNKIKIKNKKIRNKIMIENKIILKKKIKNKIPKFPEFDTMPTTKIKL